VRSDRVIILAGGTGDLGGRIATALGRRQVAFRALVRPGSSAAMRASLGDCRKFGGQAAIATGGHGSLAGWNRCPKPDPSVPL